MWHWELAPFVVSALLTALCAAAMWTRRARPGARAFTVILLSETVWSAGYVGELISPDLRGKLLWDNFQYLAVVPILPSLLAFVWDYREAWPRRAKLWLAVSAALPGATVAWVLTDPLHHQARAGARLEPAEPFHVLLYDFTAPEWVLFVQTYVIVLWAGAELVRLALNHHAHHRVQSALVGLGLAFPMLTTTLGMADVRLLLGQRDIAPASFGICALVITGAMFRGRFFDVTPVARSIVFGRLPDPVIVLDSQQRLIDVNPRAQELFGRDRKLIGQPLRGVVGASAADALSGLAADQRSELELNGLTFEARCEPLERHGVRGRIVLLRDVTARKAAEQELTRAHELLEARVSERTRELYLANEALVAEVAERKRAEEAAHASEARFRSLFDNAVELKSTLRPDGTVLAANQTALDFAQISGAEIEGRPFWEAPWWRHSAELQQRVREAVARAASGELIAMDATHEEPSGELREMAFSLKPLVSDADAEMILIAEARDITELRRGEIERAALKEALHQAQRLESLGRLAGGIAHDFNNLLTVILGQTELALTMLKSGRDPSASLAHVTQAGTSAAALTQQLLAFARKQPAAPRVLSVDEAVKQMAPMLQRLLGEDVQLDLALASEPCRVCIDPGQLEQVLLNLVVNARDAMPEGGRLSIGCELVMDAAPALQHNDRGAQRRFVCLTVADTGSGISDDVKAKIFEPFFSTKAPGKGTGIGLSTVHGIVHQAGGFIRVDSSRGKGTRFAIYLPDTEAEVSLSAPTSDFVPRGQERVALVEDQAALRELVIDQLRTLGYTVTAFAKGEDALRALRDKSVDLDLLVTDVVLSGMSGPGLVKQLREQRSDVKVLYVSGYTNGTAPVLNGTAERLLRKPFTMRDLAQAVRDALAHTGHA